jgi:hypothetical protein
VLEALLKRVDGLEAKLREKNDEDASPTSASALTLGKTDASVSGSQAGDGGEPAAKRVAVESRPSPGDTDTTMLSPATPINRCDHELAILPRNLDLTFDREPSPNPVQADALLDTYFTRFHGKPYYILDESSIRQRLQLSQLPAYLSNAISAVAARYVSLK